MGVEIKQTLERDYDLSIPVKEIRLLTFKKLDTLSSGGTVVKPVLDAHGRASLVYELRYLVPTEVVVPMNKGQPGRTPMFVVHPIEGTVAILEEVVSGLQCPVYGFQSTFSVPLTSVTDLAAFYLQVIFHVCHGNFAFTFR